MSYKGAPESAALHGTFMIKLKKGSFKPCTLKSAIFNFFEKNQLEGLNISQNMVTGAGKHNFQLKIKAGQDMSILAHFGPFWVP